MARAHAASACDQSDSIKSLAQSIAKPAYRRLQHAETAMRRAVPVLVVAFLITICVGASVQIISHQHDRDIVIRRELVALADILAERIDRLPAAQQNKSASLQDILPSLVPAWNVHPSRTILVADLDGKVLAKLPAEAGLMQVDDFTRNSIAFGLPANANGATNGKTDIVAQPIKSLPGRVIVIQQRVTSFWQGDDALTATLAATTGFVVLILGFAFHWQSARARETDSINDTVRGRIDTALNRGRCGLWDWDLARGRIFWSHSMFAMLGIDRRSELLTFGEINTLIHPEDIDLYELANQILDTKIDHIDHDFRMRHSNGHWIWLRARCELTWPAGESGAHLIGIAVDVTEQKQLAQKSAEADMRLRDAIETIPEAFVLWDAQNRLVLCNSHFQRLHGLAETTAVPGTSYETIADQGQMPILRTNISSHEDGAPGGRTFEVKLENGRWLHVSERRTKDGGYVSVGTDISTIKEHEQKLIENETRLRSSVSALLHTQMKLEQQAHQLTDLAKCYEQEKIRAEEANATKSRFLANMSHELRTPLNAIIGFSEIMGTAMFGPLGSEKYNGYCKDILSSGQYLLEVINDILDMSKIEAGRMKFDLERFDFASVVTESLRVISGRAENKKLTIHADVSADVSLIADRRAVKQIAVNLLSNAVKFTPDGGTIKIRGRSIGGSVLLTIADSGIGIAPGDMGKLGRPFEQVETQLTKIYQGSGLGLAIAKSLAQIHGGVMRMRSKPGVGTTVFIRLPQSPSKALAEAAAHVSYAAADQSIAQISRERLPAFHATALGAQRNLAHPSRGKSAR